MKEFWPLYNRMYETYLDVIKSIGYPPEDK